MNRLYRVVVHLVLLLDLLLLLLVLHLLLGQIALQFIFVDFLRYD